MASPNANQDWGANDKPVAPGQEWGVGDKPAGDQKPQGFLPRVQQFGQEHPYLSGAASLLVPGASAVLDPTQETGKGALKQAGRDVYNLFTGPGIGPIGMGAGYLAKKLGLEDRVMRATEPSNERQQVGGWGTTAAEMAIPMPKALSVASDVFPSTETLGNRFQLVNAAVGKHPVDVSKFARPAMEAQHLNQVTGDTVPAVLKRAFGQIQPTTEPLTFEDSRLLQSAAGRKAVRMAEAPKPVSPQMGGHAAQLAKGLAEANSEVASKGGVGPLYESTMRGYARRQGLENAKDLAGKVAKSSVGRGAGAAVGGGLAGYAASRLFGGR